MPGERAGNWVLPKEHDLVAVKAVCLLGKGGGGKNYKG